MASRQWFYAPGGERYGPIAEDELIGLLLSGRLSAEALVWTEGMESWAPASSVPGLGILGPTLAVPPLSSMAWASTGLLQYAGFWRRFGALILDWFLLAAIGIPLGLVLRTLKITGSVGGGANYLVSLTLGWIYFAGMESSERQATFGKQALGIVVTDLDGQRVSFARASGRHFGKVLSALILGIGYVMAAFTARKQALHDLLADCLVVQR